MSVHYDQPSPDNECLKHGGCEADRCDDCDAETIAACAIECASHELDDTTSLSKLAEWLKRKVRDDERRGFMFELDMRRIEMSAA